MSATESILTYNQKRQYRADYYDEHDEPCTLIATMRYDDSCRNGHNSFAITGELYEKQSQRGEPKIVHIPSGQTLWLNSCGCLHDEIAKRIPELAPFIKWHLCSSDGPMHYVANTVYHATGRYQGREPNLDAARSCAIWPEATAEQLQDKAALIARLPALLADFRRDVESLGFTF